MDTVQLVIGIITVVIGLVIIILNIFFMYIPINRAVDKTIDVEKRLSDIEPKVDQFIVQGLSIERKLDSLIANDLDKQTKSDIRSFMQIIRDIGCPNSNTSDNQCLQSGVLTLFNDIINSSQQSTIVSRALGANSIIAANTTVQKELNEIKNANTDDQFIVYQ